MSRDLQNLTPESGLLDPNSSARWCLKLAMKHHDERELQRMFFEAHRFLQDMLANKEPRWLVISGTNYTGKTMVAKAVLKEYKNSFGGIVPHHRLCSFWNWPEMVKRMFSGLWELPQDIYDDFLVVLDDLGAEYDPKHSTSVQVYDILTRRENPLKWLIVTTNLRPETWNQEMEYRVASRLKRHWVTTVELKKTVPFGAR